MPICRFIHDSPVFVYCVCVLSLTPNDRAALNVLILFVEVFDLNFFKQVHLIYQRSNRVVLD